MTIATPPNYAKISDDSGKAALPWILFFQGLSNGDTGEDWTPTFESLTEDGTPTIEGHFYKLSKYLVFFRVSITPATSTTSTAGTTYIDNFPLQFSDDGICFAVSGGLGSSSGHIVASTNRIYVPAWTTVTVPLTIIGIGEAQ